MGGHAFMWHFTPRMPNGVYIVVTEDLVARLRAKFSTVIVPPSLPGKETHGDVDVYCGGPLDGIALTMQELKDTVGAFELNKSEDKTKTWTYFAIHWPADLLSEMPPRPTNFKPWIKNPEAENTSAIQVDLQQHVDPMIAEWHAFCGSFGSLRPILGSILREYGLRLHQTPDNKHNGLILRIECLEKAGEEGYLSKGMKKSADVLLTCDPSLVLRFLGMLKEGEKWYNLKFATADELVVFICKNCNLFKPSEHKRYSGDFIDSSNRYRDATYYYQLFQSWVVYVGDHPGLAAGERAHWTRADIEKLAMPFFSKQEEIEQRIEQGKAEYEPKKFFASLEKDLRLLITPEVFNPDTVRELIVKTYGERYVQGLLQTIYLGTWLPETSPHDVEFPTDLHEEFLEEVDKLQLKGTVNARISAVMRCVRGKTVKFDVASGGARPAEHVLWAARKYDELLELCVANRVMLEQEQKEVDIARYKAHMERRGVPAPERQ